jgi:hypothetical protein
MEFRFESAGTKAEQRTADEDMYKSSIVKVKPGLLLITNKKLSTYSSPRHIASPYAI